MTVNEILKNIFGIDEEKKHFEDAAYFTEKHNYLFWFNYGVEPGKAVSGENLRELEKRFGKVPDTLREFYFLCGNNPDVIIGQDQWILPESYKKWEWLQRSENFVIVNENSGICRAFIKPCDFGKANPPVYVKFEENDPTILCANSVDEFVKAFLVYQGSLCMPYWNENFYFINEDEFIFIKDNFNEYNFKIEYWLGDGTIRLFYDNPDSVICILGCGLQLHYGARSKESFERLDKLLGNFGELG